MLKQFRSAKGLGFEEQWFEKSKLDGLLKSFYANVRKKDGSFHSENSLTSLRYSLAIYFLSERKTDITADSEFRSSNETFFAVTTELKKLGKAKTNHHEEITSQDLKMLYSCFDVTTPRGLQEKCLFDIIFFLVRRGRENLRQQTKQTFAIAVESTQRKYVYQAVDELDKNHRGSDNQQDSVTDPRMYEQPGNLLCPVCCFELYLSKLNPGLNSLWQRPEQMAMEDENIWYVEVPVGKNTLGLFMKKLSKSAEMSKEYTNHYIRATAVTVLDQNNFEASGHTLDAYLKRSKETYQIV